jgi:L-rhamnose mutarotase
MPRVAFRLRIRPDAIVAYEESHRQVWPDLLAKLQEVGISDYSIFRRGIGPGSNKPSMAARNGKAL